MCGRAAGGGRWAAVGKRWAAACRGRRAAGTCRLAVGGRRLVAGGRQPAANWRNDSLRNTACYDMSESPAICCLGSHARAHPGPVPNSAH